MERRGKSVRNIENIEMQRNEFGIDFFAITCVGSGGSGVVQE